MYVYSNIFVVIVVNPCIPPPDCIGIPGCGIVQPPVNPPTVDIHIDYTITQSVLVYNIPPWTCDLPECDPQITYDTDDVICCHTCDCSDTGTSTGVVVVIINNTIQIDIDTCGEICGNDENGETYIIILHGCLGTTCTDVEVDITIYNPCLDPDYLQIQPVALPSIVYTLAQSSQWNHNSFIINAIPAVLNICGDLTYTIDAGDFNVYIDYDVSL